MSTLDWSMMTGAGLLGVAGLCLLFLSWKKPGRPPHLAGGWALLFGGLILAFIANADRGVAQAAVIIMASATAWFSIPVIQGLAPPVATQRIRTNSPAGDTLRRPVKAALSGLWTFVICGPVAGGIAVLASAALFKLLRPAEGSPATAGIIAVIASVLLWAVLSVLLLIEPRAGRRSAYAGIAMALTATMAFI